MYTAAEIEAGLKLASEWYEGWRVDDLGSDQLIECIEKAKLL